MLTCWALFFVCSTVCASSVEYKDDMLFKASQISKQPNSPQEFLDAINAYTKERWDSVLVFSNKVLTQNHDVTLNDYCHYFRGVAFRNKMIFKQALKECEKVSKKFPFGYKLQLLRGEIFLELEDYENSLQAFSAIDTNNRKQLSNYRLDALQHNLGLCHFHLGHYQEAELLFKKAIQKYEEQDNYEELIAAYGDLANVYYDQYLDDQAIVYFTKAYKLSKHHGSFLLRQNAAMNMAVVEQNRKNFHEALKYRLEYEAWRDSLNDQGKIYEVAQIEKRFAVDQKQRQVKLLETRNKLKQTQLNMYLSIALLLAIILSVGIYFYRQNLKRSKLILAQKQELDVLNATKDQLFSIVSHDLRSSVHALSNSNSSLKVKLEAKQYGEVEEQLEQNSAIATNTYNMLDNLLHWALLQTQGGYFKQEEHRLSMLIDQVAYNFSGLLNGKNLSFENKIPRSVKAFVDAESIKIVLRNFMDNSIKFSNEGSMIMAELSSDNEHNVTIQWCDSGKGMKEETRLKLLSDSPHLAKKDHEKEIGSGLGMRLCKSMIEKNGGSLDIYSKLNEGTKMIVTLQKA